MTNRLEGVSVLLVLALTSAPAMADMGPHHPIDISVRVDGHPDGSRISGFVARYSGLPQEILEQPVCVCWSERGEPELLDAGEVHYEVTEDATGDFEVEVLVHSDGTELRGAYRVFFGCGTPMWYGETCVEAQDWDYTFQQNQDALFEEGKTGSNPTDLLELGETQERATALALDEIVAGCNLSYRGAMGGSLAILALVFLGALGWQRRRQ